MSDLAIETSGLGKRYRLGEYAVWGSLREQIAALARHVLRRGRTRKVEYVWALRGIDLRVSKGEVLGVIGSNGAGKSTLLKLLARITEPSEGSARVAGRIGSLLEVGTGFHPDLTGRENVFLNGAILGMHRSDIVSKFKEIVAFSEIERFIDTPVKRYSSGMRMRLAFAVAAHLDTEILLIDEVLAVGDTEFQKKCLGKMNQVAQGGRTVLFVSHHMNAIHRLCSRTLWIDDGSIRMDGPTAEVVGAYLAGSADGQPCRDFQVDPNRPVDLRSIRVMDAEGRTSAIIQNDEAIRFEYEFEVHREDSQGIYFGLILQNADGIQVLFADSRDVPGCLPESFSSGRHVIAVDIPPILAEGTYYVDVGLASTLGQQIARHEAAASFEIVNLESSRTFRRHGFLNLKLPWQQIGKTT